MAEDVYTGKDLGTRRFTVTPEEIAQHTESTGDQNPWYNGDSPFGGPVAPALFMHSESSRFDGWYLENLFGNLYIRQLWEIKSPVRAGEEIVSKGRVVDRYTKRDRDCVVCEVEVNNSSGQPVAKGFHHQSFLMGQDSGKVDLVEPAKKKPSQPIPDPTGEEIPSVKKTVNLEMCNLFYSGNRNYHTDKDAAEELGFDEVVVAGPMSVCFISELMTNRFGTGWYTGGNMDIKFINILWPDEPLIVRGVITERDEEKGGVRAHLKVWCEKADGTKTIVGTASALEE